MPKQKCAKERVVILFEFPSEDDQRDAREAAGRREEARTFPLRTIAVMAPGGRAALLDCEHWVDLEAMPGLRAGDTLRCRECQDRTVRTEETETQRNIGQSDEAMRG